MKIAAFNPPRRLGKYALRVELLHERFGGAEFPLSDSQWQELNEEAASQYDHDGMTENEDCGGLEGWKVVECWGRFYAVYVTYTGADGVFAWTACEARKAS